MSITTFEDLPVYLYCDDPECDQKHFISVNRDVYGRYSIGYVEFKEHTAVGGLALNEADTLEEALTRMKHAVDRRKKQGRT